MSAPESAHDELRAAQFYRLPRLLYGVGRLLEKSTDLESLMQHVVLECCTLFGCEGASIALYDQTQKDLVFCVNKGGPEQVLKNRRLPLGTGIIGSVAADGVPMLSNDPASDPRWYPDISEESGMPTRNLAAAPIRQAGNLLGALEVVNREQPAAFDRDDLRLLQIVADQVGSIIVAHHASKLERHAHIGLGIAGATHDFNHSLATLSMPVKGIDRALSERDWQKLDLLWNIVRKGIYNLRDQCAEILDHARADDLYLEPCDLVALLSGVVEETRGVEPKVEVSLHCEAESLCWPIDRLKVQHSIKNLIRNAFDAIREGGGSEVVISVSVNADADQLVITIHDDGPGIPVDIQQSVFEPLFTTKKNKGTGLGLANVLRCMELHGGEVYLHSTPEDGTKFTMTIPKSS